MNNTTDMKNEFVSVLRATGREGTLNAAKEASPLLSLIQAADGLAASLLEK